MKLVGKSKFILLACLICTTVAGCGFKSVDHRSSSIVQYLYPDDPSRAITPSIPKLSLPLIVGIAFVPENASGAQALTEKDKISLMEEVGSSFKQHTFVKSIELIPSAYLTREGGFENLDQIQTMHGIDVIALLSYDQAQFTDKGFASLTYWTLIGAYIVPGEKNDTHTMLDAAVYDIESRKMLFRAPGISHIKSNATPVNLSEKLRSDRIAGFKASRANLVQNLESQLKLFREKVKETPSDYHVTHRAGYTGGGSLDGSVILLLISFVGYRLWRRHYRPI